MHINKYKESESAKKNVGSLFVFVTVQLDRKIGTVLGVISKRFGAARDRLLYPEQFEENTMENTAPVVEQIANICLINEF